MNWKVNSHWWRYMGMQRWILINKWVFILIMKLKTGDNVKRILVNRSSEPFNIRLNFLVKSLFLNDLSHKNCNRIATFSMLLKMHRSTFTIGAMGLVCLSKYCFWCACCSWFWPSLIHKICCGCWPWV